MNIFCNSRESPETLTHLDFHRETARKLLLENETIHNQMHQTEKDTIDVISYLKRQDQEKDRQIEQLQNTIRDLKKEHRKESERLVIFSFLSHGLGRH